MQLVSHLALPSPAHLLPGQVLVADAVQAPAPLQVAAVVTLPAAQVAAVQTTVLSGKVHVFPFEPSHWLLQAPVPPQASREPMGLPLMAMQVPTEPASLHDSHWPSQELSQHTPSTQYPLTHSKPSRQVTGSRPRTSGASAALASFWGGLPPS